MFKCRKMKKNLLFATINECQFVILLKIMVYKSRNINITKSGTTSDCI